MKSSPRTLAFLAAFVGLCVTAVLGESWLRDRARQELSIQGLPLGGTTVEAFAKPDFLWWGTAWWIKIDTATPLVLTLDTWQGRIPAGKHTVFANHDGTNTGRYAPGEFRGFPLSIRVAKANP